MKSSWVHRITWPVFIAVLIYYVAVVLKPVLYFHVQQLPFLRTGEYLSRFLDRPGGIVQYIAQFIMQGFHSNWFGSMLLLTMLLLSAWLLTILLKIVSGRRMLFWPYVLIISSLLILRNYYFPIVVLIQLIFIQLALIALSRASFSKPAGWVLYAVLHLLVYYVLGTGSSLVLGAGTIIIIFVKVRVKEYYKIGFVLLFTILVPYLTYLYIFNFSLEDAYFSFFPTLTILSKYFPTAWFYIFTFLIPIIIALAYLTDKLPQKILESAKNRLSSALASSILLILISGITAVLLVTTFDQSAKNAALCDYYNYNGKYEKTIDIALATTDDYDFFINLSYNRAISVRGEFTSRFLNYPQLLGSQILQPDLLGSPVFKMASSDLYFDLGYISQSQHAAYAILAIEPDHPRAKMRLVETNILMGNFRAAQVYLASLADGFHYKEFVSKYNKYIEDPRKINNDRVLNARKKMMPDNSAIPGQTKERLRDLIRKNNSNKLAHEYLQACHLMDHQLRDFMNDLNPALGFFNDIPEIYGEAIIMYFFNELIPGMETFDIPDSAKDRFNEFQRVLAISGNNQAIARDSMDFLSDTYMYYVTYLSPKVTNVKVVQGKY